MFLWLTFALFAAAVATLLLRVPRSDQPAADDPDAAVYRDQLTELDSDVARGVVSEAEATSARTEIARRLLKHAGSTTASATGPTTGAATASMATKASVKSTAKSTGKPVAVPLARPSLVTADTVLLGSVAAIPALGLAIYMAVGSPTLPARPMAERLASAPDKADAEDLIAKVEQRLRENPNDGMGWQVIAPVYTQRGRFVEAGQAYERAMQLLGETPERLMGLAKSLVLANNGTVVDPARAAYARVAELDPKRVEAKFWLAIADEQNGRGAQAEIAYRAMLATAPSDAPWREAVETRLAGLTSKSSASAVASGSANPLPNPVVGIPKTPPASQSGQVQGSAQGLGQGSGQGQSSGPIAGLGLPPMSAPVLAPAAPKPNGGTSEKAGPTPAEFVAAAAGMPADMREMMMGRMIARASETVKNSPKDAAAWSRLVTGYKALGKPTEATDALKQAKAALAGDPAAETELDALARSLGLPS